MNARRNVPSVDGARIHGPHRLQHFLARAVWDHDAVRDRLADWVARQLAGDQDVLVVDRTGYEKSSTDAVGAARQYSGAEMRS
nr:transposase [Streptomyces sp. NBC_00830]